MSIATTIDERRVAKNEWGEAVIRLKFPPSNEGHAKKVQLVAQDCLDMLEEAVTGQKPLPYSKNGDGKSKAAAPAPPPKGQKALPLGPGKDQRPVAGPRRR